MPLVQILSKQPLFPIFDAFLQLVCIYNITFFSVTYCLVYLLIKIVQGDRNRLIFKGFSSFLFKQFF